MRMSEAGCIKGRSEDGGWSESVWSCGGVGASEHFMLLLLHGRAKSHVPHIPTPLSTSPPPMCQPDMLQSHSVPASQKVLSDTAICTRVHNSSSVLIHIHPWRGKSQPRGGEHGQAMSATAKRHSKNIL